MLLIVIVATLDILGLPVVSGLLISIFLYIPNVAAAVLVVILGLLPGSFMSAVVTTAASNAGIAASGSLGKAAYYAVSSFPPPSP